MRTKKNYTIFFILIFILTLFIGCKKTEVNQNPTVKFLHPDSNIVIRHDTILPITVEPYDSDGTIQKVDIFINGSIVSTLTTTPYTYIWNDVKINNAGIYIIKAVATDNDGGIGTTEISVEIYDYRIKFSGNFNFRVITESWTMGQPTHYDTAFYDGLIRKFETIDSQNDLYPNDDSAENPIEKITIEFKPSTRITSIINQNGQLTPKSGYHYGHNGAFTGTDTINFYIGGMGGLGGGYNYTVRGIRK